MTFRAEEAQAALRAIENDILAATRQALGQSAAYAAELARQSTAFKDGPNAELRGTIRRIVGGEWQQFVKAGDRKVFWALFVEDGTQPHEIWPKRTGTVSSRKSGRAAANQAPVLRFQIAGRWVSAKMVKHPGTKPTHFMRDARDQAETALAHFVEAGISAAIGR